MAPPLSPLDLAPVSCGGSSADVPAGSLALAQQADAWGLRHMGSAGHQDRPRRASAAPSVGTARVAAHRARRCAPRTSRLGAGEAMLPDHAPLVIADVQATEDLAHP